MHVDALAHKAKFSAKPCKKSPVANPQIVRYAYWQHDSPTPQKIDTGEKLSQDLETGLGLFG